MSLWVDDDFITLDDMMSMDSECAEVAQDESIVIEGDSGVIRRAKALCQTRLSGFMSFSNFSPHDLTVRDVNIPQTVAEFRYNYAGFAQVVVSGESPSSWPAIKQWVMAKTLVEFYRLASNKHADRFSDRMDEMKAQIKSEYWPLFKQRGLPIIFNPLVAPGAIMERCGTFDAGKVTLVAGAGSATDTINFAITWVGPLYVNEANQNNQESWRSQLVPLTLTNGNVAAVSIVGLIPPNGNQPLFTTSSCRYSPGIASGWNVWAGAVNSDIMYLQNLAGPIPVGTTSFNLPGNPILSGSQLGLGQFEQISLEIRTKLVNA